MTTEEGNKIIYNSPFGKHFRDNASYLESCLHDGITEKRFYTEKVKYHSSSDWLMPVVEKIESIHDNHHGYFGVHISSNSCTIQGTNLRKAIQDLNRYGGVYMSDPNAVLNTKIESTWHNVVQFIQWYNQNLKK